MRDLPSALFALVGLCACSRGEEPAAPPPTAPAAAPPAAPPPSGPTGSIRGAIKLTGTPPEMPALQRGSDPVCGATPMKAETVVVSGGGLVNAVVRVAPGSVPPVAPSAKVVVDQKDCMYRPRVTVGVGGQTLEVRNGDTTSHNVNARRLELGKRADLETLFNRGQPAGSPPVTTELKAGVEVLKLKCDMHGWMQGFVVISDNPYGAVTGEGGRFQLDGVPVGARDVQVWHELYGVKTAKVTVAEGQAAELEVAFDAAADRPASAGGVK